MVKKGGNVSMSPLMLFFIFFVISIVLLIPGLILVFISAKRINITNAEVIDKQTVGVSYYQYKIVYALDNKKYEGVIKSVESFSVGSLINTMVIDPRLKVKRVIGIVLLTLGLLLLVLGTIFAYYKATSVNTSWFKLDT